MKSNVAGIVLAGGQSQRFGSEKAVAIFQRRKLIEWVSDSLASAASVVAISGRKGSGADIFARENGLALLPDPLEIGRGPLTGIVAGLEWAARQNKSCLATLPCDAPLLPSFVLTALVGMSNERCGAYAVSPRGIESLVAVWPVVCLAHLRQISKSERQPPLKDVLVALNARAVSFAEQSYFENVNSCLDLERLNATYMRKHSTACAQARHE